MDWQERLRRHGVRVDFDDFSLVYHVGSTPAVPKEYDLPGIVGLTFRLGQRHDGALVYATTLDVGAVLGLGARMGLQPGEALAMVDTHERVHVAMQLAGVAEDVEEEQSRLADAVWLSLRHPRAAQHFAQGDFHVVTRIAPGFWEALVEEDPRDEA